MGCFSYKCQSCGKGVLSSSFSGEEVKLFLLKDGVIIQQMEGEYDSYGRVFINGTQDKSVKHALRKSIQWEKVDKNNKEEAWHQVCDLNFSEDISNGIAAIHSDCFTGELPIVRSVSDPNQGWGDEDDDECLLGSSSSKVKGKKRTPISDYCVISDHAMESGYEEKWRLTNKVRDLEFNISWNKNGDSKLDSKTLESFNKMYEDQLKEAKASLKILEDQLPNRN